MEDALGKQPLEVAPVPRDGNTFMVTHRLVLSIAVPMTLAYLTTPLLGITDTAVVGQFGDAAVRQQGSDAGDAFRLCRCVRRRRSRLQGRSAGRLHQ